MNITKKNFLRFFLSLVKVEMVEAAVQVEMVVLQVILNGDIGHQTQVEPGELESQVEQQVRITPITLLAQQQEMLV